MAAKPAGLPSMHAVRLRLSGSPGREIRWPSVCLCPGDLGGTPPRKLKSPPGPNSSIPDLRFATRARAAGWRKRGAGGRQVHRGHVDRDPDDLRPAGFGREASGGAPTRPADRTSAPDRGGLGHPARARRGAEQPSRGSRGVGRWGRRAAVCSGMFSSVASAGALPRSALEQDFSARGSNPRGMPHPNGPERPSQNWTVDPRPQPAVQVLSQEGAKRERTTAPSRA
jgi:hypothetical protein